MEITINNQKIGLEHPTFFIADIASNHDGSLERAKKLIELAKESGADAVKFQHFKAKQIVSQKGFEDLNKRQVEITEEEFMNELNKYCESLGIDLIE